MFKQIERDLIMRAFVEVTFDAAYLLGVLYLGFAMLRHKESDKQFRLFGLMAIVLGAGDAFHLVPRAYALLTTGLEKHVEALGIGKFITSITMTVFYVLLYHVWRKRYHVQGQKNLTMAVYGLAALRIALCLFPQNGWTSANPSMLWAILRNIPFALMGILVIVLFYKSSRKHEDKAFWYMWLTIVLSFAFYIPVVFWANLYPMIGMLMIPKTLAYVWTVWIGYQAMLQNNIMKK